MKLTINAIVILSLSKDQFSRPEGQATELILRQAQDDGSFEGSFFARCVLLVAFALMAAPLVRADAPPLPSDAISLTRYETLWTKSPFAVATAGTVVEESPDYYLVGVASEDGIFYASVIDRQTQEHFLLCSDKAVRGLTLKSISRTPDGQDTFAEVLRDGQLLTLKLERPPVAVASPQTSISTGTPHVFRVHRTPIQLLPPPQ